MYKSLVYVPVSIVLGFVSATVMGDGDDSETVILAAIFWLLASMFHRLTQNHY